MSSPAARFDAVFGDGRGLGVQDTLLATEPTKRARRELEDIGARMMNGGGISEGSALLEAHRQLISERPLLAKLLDGVCLWHIIAVKSEFDGSVLMPAIHLLNLGPVQSKFNPANLLKQKLPQLRAEILANPDPIAVGVDELLAQELRYMFISFFAVFMPAYDSVEQLWGVAERYGMGAEKLPRTSELNGTDHQQILMTVFDSLVENRGLSLPEKRDAAGADGLQRAVELFAAKAI